MTVFDCLKPLTLSAVGNNDRILRNKFVVVYKCPVGGYSLLSNARPPGLIVKQMPGVCPGGMLTVGIDSHISYERIDTVKLTASLDRALTVHGYEVRKPKNRQS